MCLEFLKKAFDPNSDDDDDTEVSTKKNESIEKSVSRQWRRFIRKLQSISLINMVLLAVVILAVSIQLGRWLTTERVNDSLVVIHKTKWIHLCKTDFYDQLKTLLDIDEKETKPIRGLIDDLYTVKRFTEEKHSVLKRAIDRELRLKAKLQATSHYDKTISFQGLLILLEEMLNEPQVKK